MDFIRLIISLNDNFHELLIAELFDMDFEGFEENDNQLVAFISANKFDDFKREEIERILFHYGDEAHIEAEELIAPQNWNQNWEQSIKPQQIGKFNVRPTWSAPSGNPDLVELLIDPKMAFGTGYHATTRLLLEWIPRVVKKNDEVLDAGTGTGILAIAALKMGAKSVFGFDIDEWSENNALENMKLNGVNHFEVKLGSVETIPVGSKYDLILANINRNALMELVPQLYEFLKPSGKILLSGLLEGDRSTMLGIANTLSLNYLETRQLDEWIAILLQK